MKKGIPYKIKESYLNYNGLDFKLIFVWILISISILTLSYKDVSGMLSHDSTFYLRLAENLTSGYGYFLGYKLGGVEGTYFTIWPVGYGTLIAIVAYVL